MGASVVRYANDAVLVVSRIDFSTGREVVTAFNNGDTPAKVTFPVATPDASWQLVFGSGAATGSGKSLSLTIPAVLGARGRAGIRDPGFGSAGSAQAQGVVRPTHLVRPARGDRTRRAGERDVRPPRKGVARGSAWRSTTQLPTGHSSIPVKSQKA